jgi:hypothetical protein
VERGSETTVMLLVVVLGAVALPVLMPVLLVMLPAEAILKLL